MRKSAIGTRTRSVSSAIVAAKPKAELQRDAERTRAELLAVATEVFAESGYSGARVDEIAERTRTNKLSPDELSGGTFTVTNTGSRGALFDTPIINQPQAAILGTGALVKRPMVIRDRTLGEVIAIRDMMYLSLSYDHRLVDGADAARFLSVVKARLEAGDFAGELGL